jgi:hypothetical protein
LKFKEYTYECILLFGLDDYFGYFCFHSFSDYGGNEEDVRGNICLFEARNLIRQDDVFICQQVLLKSVGKHSPSRIEFNNIAN